MPSALGAAGDRSTIQSSRHPESGSKTMADTVYRIVHREDDGFVVEISRSGVLPQTATGFATEAEASQWIAQDRRLWSATDPFSTPAARKRRGF
jgi:hypothetical protein